MKKGVFYFIFLLIVSLGLFFWIFMKNRSFDSAYGQEVDISGELSGLTTSPLPGYSSKYAVVADGEEINAEQFKADTYAVIMVKNDTKECLAAYNVHKRIYPASMTKLMTGIVVCDAIEQGKLSLDEVIELDHNISFDANLSVVQSNLSKGCKISVRNLLTALMLSSYNDYAIILAERIGGSVEGFADLMNAKAKEIGATGTHFANPHGLDDLDHYTTAYDMYLIVNEASNHEILHEIDQYRSYTYSWTDANGESWDDTATATNYYLNDEATLPSNISILAWKTGTTTGAGNCLAMKVKINDSTYTMMVADSVSKTDLYAKYSILFNLAN